MVNLCQFKGPWLQNSLRTTALCNQCILLLLLAVPLMSKRAKTGSCFYNHKLLQLRECSVLRDPMHVIRKWVSECWAITTSCLQRTETPCKQLVSVHVKKCGACKKAVCMWGISPVMRLTQYEPGVAGSISQERGGGWNGVWSTPRPSDITMRSTKIQWPSLNCCCKRQQSQHVSTLSSLSL